MFVTLATRYSHKNISDRFDSVTDLTFFLLFIMVIALIMVIHVVKHNLTLVLRAFHNATQLPSMHSACLISI